MSRPETLMRPAGELQFRAKKARPSTHDDRLIPNRSAMDLDVSHFKLVHNSDRSDVTKSPAKEEYKKELAQTLLCSSGSTRKVLAFSSKAVQALQVHDAHQTSLRNLYTHNREAVNMPRKYTRHIPQAPERILDAPELIDDFYLNLLDWSSNNVLGVGLGDSIYLWNANNGSIQHLLKMEGENQHVTSLSWVQQGDYMAVGASDHTVQIWDAGTLKKLRTMSGHKARVSSLSWNGPLLSSGGRDSTILHHDVRVPEHRCGTLKGHTQEVCGLKWSPAGNLLASGGNDNILNIWDDRSAAAVPPPLLVASRARVRERRNVELRAYACCALGS